MKFHLFDLGMALREGFRHPLQSLSLRERHAVPGDGLDGSHIGQSTRRIIRERAVPPGLVPLFPPTEEGTRDIDRIDFKRAGEEAVRR